MKKMGIFRMQRGFTLVEAMVTVAVLVVLASIAVPGLQTFTTRSGMNAIRDDFSIALQRARLDAINRNTCVSICQLAAGSTNTCETTQRGNWHMGWVVFSNEACSGAVPTQALVASNIIAVRQAGDPRFQLMQDRSQGIVTFDPRGTQLGQFFSATTSDARYTGDGLNPMGRDITVNMQGRVSVAPAKEAP